MEGWIDLSTHPAKTKKSIKGQ